MDLVNVKYADLLKPNEIKVYNAVLDVLKDATDLPSNLTLELDLITVQEKVGMSTATIKRHFKTLQSKGLFNNIKLVEYNAKYLFDYFCNVYEKTFNQAYNSRSIVGDMTQLKKIVNRYDKDSSVYLINTTVLTYRTRFATPDYPLPTVGILCSWAISRLIDAEDREKAKKQAKTMPKSTMITVSRGVALDLDLL